MRNVDPKLTIGMKWGFQAYETCLYAGLALGNLALVIGIKQVLI